MKIAGIDYSLCSPAITVIDTTTNTARGFYLTDVKRNAKNFNLGWYEIIGSMHDHHLSEEHRYDNISNWALSIVKDCDVVFMEDYALGAKGRVFHIAENAGLLKWKMWSTKVDFKMVGPTVLKKYATGKGNADKQQMHESFRVKTGTDLVMEICPGSTKVANPVSDLVDSCWLAWYGSTAV
jgi:Holliday junction resolvasome RuvABC endonuclease subunit